MANATIRVEVLRTWPRGFEQTILTLPAGATVAAAIAACGMDAIPDCAVFGERATAATVLHDGDRLELLRPLLMDPKDARRRRAGNR